MPKMGEKMEEGGFPCRQGGKGNAGTRTVGGSTRILAPRGGTGKERGTVRLDFEINSEGGGGIEEKKRVAHLSRSGKVKNPQIMAFRHFGRDRGNLEWHLGA